ncbi:MAG: flagellin [Pseudomonadota bacterium]
MVTNVSAMNALSALRAFNAEFTDTSNRIATGNRINEAADAPAFWGAVSETRADVGMLRQMESTLDFGRSLMSVTNTALGTIRESLVQMRDLFVQATPAGVDRAALQTGIAALQNSMSNAIDAATFNGVNLLSGDANGTALGATFSVVSGYNGTAVTTIDITVANVEMDDGTNGFLQTDSAGNIGGAAVDILAVDISAIADADAAADMAQAITLVDTLLGNVTTAELTVGTAQNSIESQINFNAAMINAKESAVASLVEANVEEEAAKLTALQTQQQLAIQALSISNSSVSAVLGLFR